MPAIEKGKVCIFGGGGPVARTVYDALKNDYEMRLVDIATLDEVQKRGTAKGFPKPPVPEAPNEWRVADILDYDAVVEAMQGCDAVINLTVFRSEPVRAFKINLLGIYNIMKAAVELKPKRVIQTGPVVLSMGYEGDYRYDYEIPDGFSPRPGGNNIYPLTKTMGNEVVTAFAEEHDLDVMTLLVSRLRPHDGLDDRDDNVMITYSTAWDDLGSPFYCALRAPQCPNPNETFFICSDLPMGKYKPEKAERLLGWKAKHDFRRFYTRGGKKALS
ncbi:MAG: NAD-dependent epimerase/dehydratase family protein [Candidatus Sumerlaeia bacterium]